MGKCTTYNGRFYEMAAVAPQKRQCDFEGFAPTRSSVKPPLHKAATTLAAILKQHLVKMGKKNVGY